MKYQALVIVLDRRLNTKKASLQRKANFLLEKLHLAGSSFEIYLVNNRFMRKNVLAFPHPRSFPKPDIQGHFLGEVYLNPYYIKDFHEDFEEMLIHGLLHLVGYDHMKRNDRIRMEQKEKFLKKELLEQSL